MMDNEAAGSRAEAAGDDPRQKPLDFLRGTQLRLLQDCELPKGAQDKTGHGVRAMALKAVLLAIDHFGRGRSGGAFASVRTLAATANLGPRTTTRAIEVLQQLGLLCVTNDGPRYGHMGSPTNRYTIVWSELAVLVDRGPLSRTNAGRQNQSAPATDQSALAREPERPGGRPERPGGRPERPGGRPERPGGAQNVSSNDQETDLKRRRDVGADGAREFLGDGGGRIFTEDQVAAVRAKANTLHRYAPARTLADRDLVLKIATLWEDRELPEDAVEQVIESFLRAAEAGKRLERPLGWLWTTLRQQCWRYSLKLEELLVTAEFPRELLAPPAARQAVSPAHEVLP